MQCIKVSHFELSFLYRAVNTRKSFEVNIHAQICLYKLVFWSYLSSRPVSSIGRALVTFVVIDREILSTVIRTVPLLWHVQKFQFLVKLNATSTGKLLDSLPRNNAVVSLSSGEFNVAFCHDPE
jgi:hypothetical protein